MMYALYGSLLLLLIAALGMLSIPFLRQGVLLSRRYAAIAVFITFFSIILYHYQGAPREVNAWNTTGNKHYQLLTEYNKLGGIQGIISRIQLQLKNHPDDAKGWFILGKLYLANQDYAHATSALQKAHQLAPHDQEINHYYRLATQTGKPKR